MPPLGGVSHLISLMAAEVNEYSCIIYVSQHIRLPSQDFTLILQLEPRDTWCLRVGFTPGIGRFVYIRKAFTALYFLAFKT